MENQENLLEIQTATTQEENEISKFPLWRILYKNIWFMLIITILVGALGLGYGVLKSKKVYTAECNVLLSVSISKSTEEQSAKYDISLAKLYLPTLTEVMKSTIVQKRANDIYASKGKTGTVSTGAVSINYNEDGLIFSMAYSDESEQACQDKLTAFIEASTKELEENGSDYFHAQEFLLTPTKNNYVITSSDNLMKYIVVGVGAGLVFSVLIVFLIYLLDNKVKTPTELEELTGSSLLAYIEKDPE